MKNYIWNLLIAFDQQCNALLGGSPDETISARCARINSPLAPIIDFFAYRCFGQSDHCYKSLVSEIERKQLPSYYWK